MKQPNTLPFITGALLLSAAFSFTAGPRAAAQAVGFASTVVDYTAGTGISAAYQNSASALGKPGGSPSGGTLNPFSPNFAGSELTGIGLGGRLTLGLSNFVTVGGAGTREIGIFGNVGITAASTNPPTAGNPAVAFGVRSVLISVSADGVNFVPLNAGALITSTLPANYYTNPDTTNSNAAPPANPAFADFGKPFTGSLADFNGATYAQALTTLDGSAGGTWLDLSSTGLSQVGYIRFSEPASSGVNGGIFYLNGVSLNGALLGANVPEPRGAALLILGAGLALAWRGQRRAPWARVAGGAGVTAAAFLGLAGAASAQTFNFADIRNWTGVGSNRAAMVVDWHDAKGPESLVWGYRFNGAATGLQMLQAIDAADPRLAFSFAYDGALIYGIGYDLNHNGGTFMPGTPGFDGNGNSTETGGASDPGDHYAEGVFSKFWGYDVATGSPYGGGGTWAGAQTGADARTLVDGSWDGWSLSYDETNFTVPDPGLPAPADAAPEPAAWIVAALGSGVLFTLHRSRRRRPGVAVAA